MRQVYRKFRHPAATDIGNLKPGVSRDRIFESWLVTRLAGDQAIYRTRIQSLYFCDPASGQTSHLLEQVFRGMDAARVFERVRIDDLGYFLVGLKVSVTPDEIPVVVAALRLGGVEVESLDL